jgi:hypothetical protein
MEKRFHVGDTVELFDGELYEEDRLSCLVPGALGVVIAVGHDCGSKGWDYEVRFDNLPGREGIALDWWLYESELVDPFKDVEIDVASML